jgi:hypothetical protein
MSVKSKRELVMAGLVPAIHVFAFKTWMPATQASQRVRPEVAGPMTSSATPFFERLCAGMTKQRVASRANSRTRKH